jgi:hypothetical protein
MPDNSGTPGRTSLLDFPEGRHFILPLYWRGRKEVGVLRQRLWKARSPTSAAVVNPHPNPPPEYKGRG